MAVQNCGIRNIFREALKHDQVTKELTATLQDKQLEAATLAQVCHACVHMVTLYMYI